MSMLGHCSTDGVPREFGHIGIDDIGSFRRVRDVDDYWLPPSCFYSNLRTRDVENPTL